MRDPLTIAVAQPLCVPNDVATNAATHAASVHSARARVVVFPELSLTGYELDAPAITVASAGPRERGGDGPVTQGYAGGRTGELRIC